ncbi:hypothetical protein G4B88_016209 [Cannabis sativa]|uniref:Uncharacterized protein n=1 Tax=Cannabis sativa TaxID=3483 RepID=A0A7J6EYS1_CANSA|nr:hypothetical protein G4B88_016209 [Cannabis sativa]
MANNNYWPSLTMFSFSKYLTVPFRSKCSVGKIKSIPTGPGPHLISIFVTSYYSRRCRSLLKSTTTTLTLSVLCLAKASLVSNIDASEQALSELSAAESATTLSASSLPPGDLGGGGGGF